MSSNHRPGLKEQILELRKQGKSYREISEELDCHISSVSYWLTPGAKERNKIKARKIRHNEHPLTQKIRNFTINKVFNEDKPYTTKANRRISNKVSKFFQYQSYGVPYMTHKQSFTTADLMEKIGDNPTCYITGKPIDLTDTRSYHLDHIVPRSKGGKNTLDNANICTRIANLSKNEMTYEEYVEHCRLVVEHHDSQL